LNEIAAELIGVFDAAVPLAHQEKCVVLVRHIADEPRGRFHHTLQVGRHLLAIHAGRHIFDGQRVRPAREGELQDFLVTHQHGAVVKHVEIRREKRVGLACHRIEGGRNARPACRQLEGRGCGMLDAFGEMQEQPGGRDEGARVVNVIPGDERDRSLDIVVQDNRCGVAGRHAPGVRGDLLPRQGLPRPVFGAEVAHVFGILNAVEPWVFVASALLLVAVSVLAGLVPALRAARVDPMVCLKYE